MFGLCFIYIIGALIVGISLLLEYIQAWLYRHQNLNEHAYLQWTANETLQLQRMAYQGLESGQWSGFTNTIPLTEPGNILVNLTRSYPLDRKKKPDVEQGDSAEKRTGITVTTVRTAPPTQVETDSSIMTPCNDDSNVDQVSVGGRQSVEVVPPVHSPRVENVLPPAEAPPAEAAPMEVQQPTPKGSGDPITTLRECD